MEKLAKKIAKFINKEYDDDVDYEDVLDWFAYCDEDELVINDIETLAEWFMDTH